MTNEEEGFVGESSEKIQERIVRIKSEVELRRVAEAQMADLWQIVGEIEKHLFRVKMNLCFYSVEAAQMAMLDLKALMDKQT